ncbi:hypothetical protein ACRCRK_27605, partial [Pseudomonas aeruginosa]
TWTHEVSGTSGSDDWRSPVARGAPPPPPRAAVF